MKKILEKKNIIINEITNLISDSVSIALIEFSKTTSLEIKNLRKILSEKEIKIKVFKNTLIKKALKNKMKIC